MAVSPSKALRLRNIASHIDLLFCNRREAAALIANDPRAAEFHDVRRPSIDQLGRDLQQLGFSQFVLSDGPAPVLVTSHTEKQQIQVPELNRQRSVNGAGDAMAGATLGAWITGMTLPQAVLKLGLPMAARVVSGARPVLQI
jgi:sugar/nucleoside kinase (ribokinase family)